MVHYLLQYGFGYGNYYDQSDTPADECGNIWPMGRLLFTVEDRTPPLIPRVYTGYCRSASCWAQITAKDLDNGFDNCENLTLCSNLIDIDKTRKDYTDTIITVGHGILGKIKHGMISLKNGLTVLCVQR